jgi:SAM-dependent methyltransferase
LSAVYDTIGTSYTATRRTDPRISQVIWAELHGCRSVLNVGAGAGAYEPPGTTVVAVEPSAAMRAARPAGSAPCVIGVAESLPFDTDSFDATLAILTLHHWSDYVAGLRELARVARRRVVVLHWDQDVLDQFWLAEYVPEGFAFDRQRAPSLDQVVGALNLATEVIPVMIPHDCQDGFAAAFWRRPAAYLDPTIRAGMSMFAQTEPFRGDGLDRLARDLDTTGAWMARHRALLDLVEHDCGYRLVVGSIDAAPSPLSSR